CWSPQHEEARAWLLGEIRAAGLEAWVDPAGNVFGAVGTRAFGADAPAVLTGSHIDTVPEGGILDGALGVLAGLEALQTIREGQADHAGTTPMERRRDGFLAAAEYALKARELVLKHGGGKSVTNVGVVRVHPGVTNIVPARGELVHELRGPDPETLAGLDRRSVSLARRVARRRGIDVEIQPMSATEPAICSARVQAAIEQAC